MDPRPVCCEPCEALSFCRPEGNCCLECHFSYEEELAFPFLPQAWRDRIAREHVQLQASGFPPAAVAKHAAMEERVFQIYCPDEICEIIERDHIAHDHGQLSSRRVVPVRQNAPATLPISRRGSGRGRAGRGLAWLAW